jgi:ArsR family transcriptional regulator, arsenate/arsenite/antimonite-responsive transcriptional repressor
MKKIATISSSSCCAPGAPPLPEGTRADLAVRFKALGDPTRIAIVNRLAGAGEVCVCAFEDLGLSQPTISHHLRILREAGLVDFRRSGTWAYYRLVPESIAGLSRSLAAA